MGNIRMIPLVVDLDRTLITTDLLFESLIGSLKKRPWLALIYPFWFVKGKGYLKSQLTKRFTIDVYTLCYRQEVLDYIKEKKKQGVVIILATASHKYYAFEIAQHLNLFDDVMASNKTFNLSSHHKAQKLIERFGVHGFDYMGDHRRDFPVWEASNLSILVNVSNAVITKTKHLNTLILSKKNLS